MTFQQFLRELAGITQIDKKLDQLLKTTGDLLTMANKLTTEIDDLKKTVANLKTVDESAIALIGGFSTQLKTAVAAALDLGATAEQLASLSDLKTALDADSVALATAVSANTAPPAAPPASPTGPPVQTSAPTA